MQQAATPSLYTRLGGYDAIAAVVDDLLARLRSDALLARFWTSPRSADTNDRERQLAVDFVAASAGGPTIYLGRDMKLSHKGMGITKGIMPPSCAVYRPPLMRLRCPNQSAARLSPSSPVWKRT